MTRDSAAGSSRNRTRPDVTQIFVYGTLRHGQPGAELLGPFELGREPASASGRLVLLSDMDLEVAVFDPEGHERVGGEVVRIDPALMPPALDVLDAYEGLMFRRVVVRVRTELGGRSDAFAYEWAGAWRESSTAVRRKLEMAAFHLDALHETSYKLTVPFQAHFEGVLYSSDAAVDQLDAAVRRELAFTSSTAERAVALQALLGAIQAFNRQPIRTDARLLRNRATHHHYSKHPTRWDAIVVEPVQSSYRGSREIIEYSDNVVDQMNALERLADEFERVMARSSADDLPPDSAG